MRMRTSLHTHHALHTAVQVSVSCLGSIDPTRSQQNQAVYLSLHSSNPKPILGTTGPSAEGSRNRQRSFAPQAATPTTCISLPVYKPNRMKGASMRRKKRDLQLPPALPEESPPSIERALPGGPGVLLLLPQATERLRRRLCPVAELRLGKIVGRGEKQHEVYIQRMHV